MVRILYGLKQIEMKRILYIISVILLIAVSCVKESIVKPTTDPSTDGKVKVTFYVDAPEANPATKAFADEPSITTMHVAIFGSSGYLKEYVEAELEDVEEKNYDGTDATVYKYSVNLTITGEKTLYADFIANGPSTIDFSYEDAVIGKMLATAPQDCYWQRIKLPYGIQAKPKLDDEGNPTDEYLKNDDGTYQVLVKCVDPYLTMVPLVRNFARLKVTADAKETSNIEVVSYALINYPSTGSVAAYDEGFVMNYQDSTFAQLRENYSGNLPATATLNTSVPAETDFVNAGGYLYMYERPRPIENPTAMIVKVKYYPNVASDDETYEERYYKIFVQDDDEYLPIFRNFEYKINITKVKSGGFKTIEEAYTSTGSGDISANQETKSLTDISDGVSRLYVEYTEKTLIAPGTYELLVKYIPDITNPDVTANDQITFKVGKPTTAEAVFNTDDSGNYEVSIADSDITSGDHKGWRKITYTTTGTGTAQKIQEIKVTGTSTSDGITSTVYRYVKIILLPKKVMRVECDPEYVLRETGKEMAVNISIPKDLPSSIFPLYFNIEAENMNLTPNNDNLPVYSDTSRIYNDTTKDGIVYDSEKSTDKKLRSTNVFYYKKTLQYTDYKTLEKKAASDTSSTPITITAYFKTTDTDKGGIVYVTNDYFYDAYDSFARYSTNEFYDLAYSTGTTVFAEDEFDVDFSFKLKSGDEDGTAILPNPVVVTLTNLEPAEDEDRLEWVSGTTYNFYPTSTADQTLHLRTTNAEEAVKVELSAEFYNDAELEAERGLLDFQNLKYNSDLGSVASSKDVDFSFNYVDPYTNKVTITVSGVNVSGAYSSTTGTLEYVSGNTFTYTHDPNSTSTLVQLYFTSDGSNTVTINLAAENYNNASATKERTSYEFTDYSISTVNLGTGQTATLTFKFDSEDDRTYTQKTITIKTRGLKYSTDYYEGTIEEVSAETDANGITWYTYTYTPNYYYSSSYYTQTLYFTTDNFGYYPQVTLSGALYGTKTFTNSRRLYTSTYYIYTTGSGAGAKDGPHTSYGTITATFTDSSTSSYTNSGNTSSGYYYGSYYTYLSKDFGDKVDVTNADVTMSASVTYKKKGNTTTESGSTTTTLSKLADVSYSNYLYLTFE